MLSVAWVLLTPTAEAAGFQAKTMRAPLSAVEVERPLVIGRGWLEFGLGFDYKLGTGAWTDTGGMIVAPGAMEPFDNAQWLYTTERLQLRYGVMRRAELYWDVPFHYVRLTNDLLGTDIADFGVGDPRFGWKYEWIRKDGPIRSVITDLQVKLPVADEAPGTYIGGPNTMNGFLLGTGTTDLGLYVRGKQGVGAFALTGSVGYVFRLSGVTQYVIETTEQQFDGRFKPGDEVHVELAPMFQVGPAAISAGLRYVSRRSAQAGTTSPGLDHDAYLDPIEGTAGYSIDVIPAVTLNATRGVDVRAAVGVPFAGAGLLFPLEEVTPTYGLTYSGSLLFRY